MPTKRDRIAEDATAQRLLNLAFIFNTTTRPLTTDVIISDTDLGYGSGNRESDVRKFRRDRQKLAEQGFEIVCADGDGTAENEASSWVLDRARTFATAGIITNDDASILADAIDEYLSASLTPLRAPLMRARAKILELVRAGDAPQQQAAGGPAAQDGAEQTMLDIVWLAFSLRRALTFSYTNGHGGHSRRSVAIYGIFSHEGATYIVGFDDAAQAVRTFRVDRMERALRPGKRYEIPASFDIHAYLFLPFDFGDGEAVEASFSLPGAYLPENLMPITHERGALTRAEDGSLVWTVSVRDLDAAAALAFGHARDGMRPVAPVELIARWNALIEKAVANHVAR